MACTRHTPDDLFFVKRIKKGQYRACVDLQPGTKGKFRYCRRAGTRSLAEQLILCLQHELAIRPGPVFPVIEAWRDGRTCFEENLHHA